MIMEESNGKDEQGRENLIKILIINKGKELELLPISSENESVYILYEAIFSQLSNGEKETSEDGLMDVLKDILRKFEEISLESAPVYSATNL
ncbi:hypothetical protein F2Q69_00056138 [Brassica cretica]|uniref:Uncharacterized protein n=1 Tax=Brassica cretica TaxID=69181 RepID=A0A8S9N4D9_BRACR|nr:hypothetical protein F2Q69_00056138 [Brassica cretica]